MSDTQVESPEGDDDLVRQRLLRRIALAGVLIVVLVGSLAMFDAVFVHPGPPPAGEVPAVAIAPAAPEVSGEIAEAQPESVAEVPPLEAASEPAAEVAPPEQAPPPAVTQTESPPASKPATRQESKSITHPPLRTARPLAPIVPESTAAPTLPPVPEVKPPRPQIAATQPLAAQRSIANQRNYLVQMGVFSNIANAEDLKRRLDTAGIPAHIEARVQVGPFKNKIEAEAAQKKLAQMGLSGLLVSPRK